MKIHMDFFQECGHRPLKVMNEHLLPNLKICDPEQWNRIKP